MTFKIRAHAARLATAKAGRPIDPVTMELAVADALFADAVTAEAARRDADGIGPEDPQERATFDLTGGRRVVRVENTC